MSISKYIIYHSNTCAIIITETQLPCDFSQLQQRFLRTLLRIWELWGGGGGSIFCCKFYDIKWLLGRILSHYFKTTDHSSSLICLNVPHVFILKSHYVTLYQQFNSVAKEKCTKFLKG